MIKKVEVYYHDQKAGLLAILPNHRVAFEYSDEWIESGFAISPFSLPCRKELFVPDKMIFDGLWGVFADSLPDAWGRLLVDRMIASSGKNTDQINVLDRLSIVGSSGMGALEYRPVTDFITESEMTDLDTMATHCHNILNHQETEDLDCIFRLGGSSGGARPKVVNDEWIIKFPASGDMTDVGIMEKEYADCAVQCGITCPETKLISSEICSGYFASRRFDREKKENQFIRKHMLTAAALLETDWRTSSFDYHTLMKMTVILSRSNNKDIEQMYRRMCFNVFAHNRDDHAKNFSWIFDDEHNCWHLSPAYDLTWSTTYFGEHATTINGNGKDPSFDDLYAVGKKTSLSVSQCKAIAEEIFEATREIERKWRGIRS